MVRTYEIGDMLISKEDWGTWEHTTGGDFMRVDLRNLGALSIIEELPGVYTEYYRCYLLNDVATGTRYFIHENNLERLYKKHIKKGELDTT